MANEVEVRYLKDKEGNTFIPITHADYIIDLPENLNGRLIKLENDNYYLSNKVEELEGRIENIEKENNDVLS